MLSPGQHVYEISYRIDGALTETEQGAAFIWDVVARGWQMPIERSEVRVGLPVAPRGASCATGTGEVCRVDWSRGGVVVRTGLVKAPSASPWGGRSAMR